jgi:phosphohistidine phosphatase
MKTLYLLRHAKSDPSVPIQDKDRPLNERGRIAAPRMGAAMAARRYMPDIALVSSAERTRQTWLLAAPELGRAPPVEFSDRLYLASALRLLDVVRQINSSASSALLIGHNPGLEDLAARLAAEDQAGKGKRALELMKAKFPTCALAVLEFDIADWQHLHLKTGRLVAFLTPAMLED